MAMRTRNASRGHREQGKDPFQDEHVECRCRKRQQLDLDTLAACRKCGTAHHKVCIHHIPTSRKFMNESECLRCTGKNGEQGVAERSQMNAALDTARRSSKASRHQQQRRSKRVMETTKDPDRSLCDCLKDLRLDDNLVPCDDCHTLHRPLCIMPDGSVGSALTALRCQHCTKETITKLISQQEDIQRMFDEIDRNHSRTEEFYTRTLWKHYCNLPNGNASEKVIEATRTHYRDGTMVPIVEAPQNWIQDVGDCVFRIFKDAGDKVKDFVGPAFGPEAMPLDLGILVQWRALAWWMLHRGPYKRKTAQLGILAEVLGFVEKGTIWEGPINAIAE